MTTHATVVFEKGTLRPTRPIFAKEGQTFDITMTPVEQVVDPEDDDTIRRIRAAKSIQELFAIANEPCDEGDAVDLLKALDANREFAGDYRMLSP